MKKLKNLLMQVSFKLYIILIFVTGFFLLEHFLYQGWDFSAYVLNAKYIFSNGQYFEIYRAPLMSMIIGFFSFLGWRSAEYAYIIFVSVLFFFSSIFLARTLKLNEFYFYLFSVNAFVIIFGIVEGTELLSLALLELFIALVIRNYFYAGFFLGLACLTRYPLVVFFPLILFHRGLRLKIISAFTFVIAFIPWFIYNHYYWGNIFYSIADSYALNILYRDYVPHTFNIHSVLLTINILLPLVLLGIFYFVKKKDFSREKLILILSFIVILYSVYTVKADVVRYYLPLTIPFVFFAVYAIMEVPNKIKNYFIILFMIFTLIGIMIHINNLDDNKPNYSYVFEAIEDIDNCRLASNIWVDLSYNGRLSEPYPQIEMLNSTLEESYILFVYSAREPDYIVNGSFLEQFPVYEKKENLIILGDTCSSIETVNSSYLQKLNKDLSQVYNYTVSGDPCEILFSVRCSTAQ